MSSTPGHVRIRGAGRPLLAGADVQIEVEQGDGSWLPLRGVVSVAISVLSDDFVKARIEVLVRDMDLDGVTANEVVWIDQRSWWQRVLAWARP